MILGCGLPILAILLLPFFGFTGDNVFLLAIFLMFGLHFFMMGSHDHGSHQSHGHLSSNESDPHTIHNENANPKFETNMGEFAYTTDLSQEFTQKSKKKA